MSVLNFNFIPTIDTRIFNTLIEVSMSKTTTCCTKILYNFIYIRRRCNRKCIILNQFLLNNPFISIPKIELFIFNRVVHLPVCRSKDRGQKSTVLNNVIVTISRTKFVPLGIIKLYVTVRCDTSIETRCIDYKITVIIKITRLPLIDRSTI